MKEYLKTTLPAILSVRSIVTVFHRTFENYVSEGESHDFPELLHVANGHHNVQVDDTLFELDPGEIIIYAPNAHHKSVKPSNATVDIISFESDAPDLAHFYNRVIVLNDSQRGLLAQIIAAGVDVFEYNREKDGLVGMMPRAGTSNYVLQQLKNQLELFFIALLQSEQENTETATASNRKNYQKEQFDALSAYLKARLGESLTLEQISRDCGMSSSTLKRLCKAHCGCAPIAYFVSLRLAEAKRMIRETSMNLTQIAECLGFQSVYHFSKLFKKKTGMTPSDYAKSERINK